MGRILFISDLHFNHKNIIEFDKRPYANVDEMNESLIKKWNNAVNPDDIVYILGDFSWDKKPEQIVSLLKKINGDKKLIKGNHDRCSDISTVKNAYGHYIKDMDVINVNGRRIVMCHYPIASWRYMQYKNDSHSILLYGHVHMTKEFYIYEQHLETLRENGVPALAYNVGASCPWMNHQPRTLEEIVERYNLWVEDKLID